MMVMRNTMLVALALAATRAAGETIGALEAEPLTPVSDLEVNRTGDLLSVAFEWHGQQLRFDMTRVQGLYTKENEQRHALGTFEAEDGSVASVNSDGDVHGLFQTADGESIKLGSATRFQNLLGEDGFRKLSQVSEGHLAGAQTLPRPADCGSDKLPQNVEIEKVLRVVPPEARRMLRSARKLQGGSPASSFLNNQCPQELKDELYEFEVGFVVDYPFYYQFKSVDLVKLEVESIVAASNVVLKRFFNFMLVIKFVDVADSFIAPPNDSSLNDFRSCPYGGITRSLTNVRDYGLLPGKRTGHVHLLTTCYSEYIGMAFRNGGCLRFDNAGVTRISPFSEPYLTFLHEFGHNLGAGHSPDNGGIMAATVQDGKLKSGPKIVGFGPPAQRDICNFLPSLLSTCQFFDRRANIDGECGNRVIDNDFEQCECPNGAKSCAGCKDCQLEDPTMECSETLIMAMPGNLQHGAVAAGGCCVNGRLQPADTACTGSNGPGYCASGQCLNMCELSSFNLAKCAPPKHGGCVHSCLLEGQSASQCGAEYDTSALFVREVTHVPDLTYCSLNSGARGMCLSGRCEAVAVQDPPPPQQEQQQPAPEPETPATPEPETPATPEPAPAPAPAPGPSPSPSAPAERVPLPSGTRCPTFTDPADCCKYMHDDNTPCMPAQAGEVFQANGNNCKPLSWIEGADKQHRMGTCPN